MIVAHCGLGEAAIVAVAEELVHGAALKGGVSWAVVLWTRYLGTSALVGAVTAVLFPIAPVVLQQ